MSYFPEFEERCRTEFGAPEGFTIIEAELVGSGRKPNEYTHCKVTGAVYEPVTRGKRKGEPNWRKAVEGTERVYYLSTSHSDRCGCGAVCQDIGGKRCRYEKSAVQLVGHLEQGCGK